MKKDFAIIMLVAEMIEMAVLMAVGINESDIAIGIQIISTMCNAISFGIGYGVLTLKEKNTKNKKN